MRVISKINIEVRVALKAGKTIVFPTETSYGLGCDAANEEAVDKIFAIKGRPKHKPLLVIVPSVDVARQYLVWNELLEKIANKYWPGLLTVVGAAISPPPQRRGRPVLRPLARGAVSADGALAVRVTAHPVAAKLAELLGRPLVATSANPSGAGELYSAREVMEAFSKQKLQPDMVLDYGELPRRQPTTVVSIVDGEIKVLREGEIKCKI